MRNTRRKNALTRLENQLASGTKTQKKTTGTKIPLSENDVKKYYFFINENINTFL